MQHAPVWPARVMAIAFLLVACGPSRAEPSSGAQSGAVNPVARDVPQKPLVIALSAEPASLDQNLSAGSNNSDFGALANGYLTYHDPPQVPKPYLAAEVPSVENGTWKLLPDGRMDVTYRLRPNARWHDGRAVTAHDYVFGYQVRMEGSMPVQYGDVEKKLSGAAAADDYTLNLVFAEPYLWAGRIHSPNMAPMPKELLEALYLNNREGFINGPHWREQYVGSGPYRLEQWEPGVSITFRAFDGFVLGKPPIDQLTVRFILDANTIVANLLSGTVDVSYFVAIGFPQGEALEQAAWGGTVAYWRGNPRFIEFQQRDWGNLQKAVLDVRVRRALLHAIDRRAIVEGLYAGKTESPHFWLAPNNPAYPAVDRVASKYEFDPSRAEALLREAGWARGADGVTRGTGGDPLDMPMLTVAGEFERQEAAVVADFWKNVGATVQVQSLTPQQNRDGEFRSKFPAVSYGRRGFGYESMVWTREDLSNPEKRWSGNNRSGYVNPGVEAAWIQVLATVDDRERERHLVDAIKRMTADAVVTPTHLQPRTLALRSGLRGVRETWVEERAIVWNIWEWSWS